jgi:hypothetical protein
VRAEGLEPTRSFEHRHLKPARLPFRHARALSDPTAVDQRRLVGYAALLGLKLTKGSVDVRPAEQFDAARRLIAAGVNDCAISRQLGVPRPTVQDWRRRPQIRPRMTSTSSPCGVAHDFSGLPPAVYCYLLGMYLGDGCISRCRQVWRLRITLDKKYPKIVDRCREAIDG